MYIMVFRDFSFFALLTRSRGISTLHCHNFATAEISRWKARAPKTVESKSSSELSHICQGIAKRANRSVTSFCLALACTSASWCCLFFRRVWGGFPGFSGTTWGMDNLEEMLPGPQVAILQMSLCWCRDTQYPRNQLRVYWSGIDSTDNCMEA